MANTNIQVGDRIRIKEEVRMTKITYPKGHEFKVYNSSYRGLDLIDDEGNKLDETLFINHLFEKL